MGIAYRYPVLASDADPGDVLEFAKGAGPVAMTIDAALGVVRWTPGPGDLGVHPVQVRVEDSQHNAVFQVFDLEVREPVSVPDVLGLARAAAESAISGAGLAVGAISSASHPTIAAGLVGAQSPPAGSVAEAGSPVALVLSNGPGPADTDNDGDGFTENEGDCDDGAAGVHPGATDGAADGVDQDCDGVDGSQPPVEIVVVPAALTLLQGETVPLQAFGVFADGTSQNLTAIVTWSSTNGAAAGVSTAGVVNAAAAGSTTIQATRGGVTGSAGVVVVDLDAFRSGSTRGGDLLSGRGRRRGRPHRSPRHRHRPQLRALRARHCTRGRGRGRCFHAHRRRHVSGRRDCARPARPDAPAQRPLPAPTDGARSPAATRRSTR